MSAEQPETTKCFACHSVMHRATRLERAEYNGLVSDEYEAPLFRCSNPNCLEEMATGRDMRVTEQQMNVLKARFDAASALSVS